MRPFNYSVIKNQKWDSEILGLIAAIYKEAGKQELYLKQRPEELEKLVEEVLARDEDGNPVCVIQRHGNGVVVLLTAAVEMQLAHKHGRIMEEPGYYRIYQYLRHFIPDRKIAKIDNVNVGLTEHIVDENRRILVLINYDPDPVEVQLHLEKGWKIEKMHRGTLQLAENDCSVLECYADNRLI